MILKYFYPKCRASLSAKTALYSELHSEKLTNYIKCSQNNVININGGNHCLSILGWPGIVSPILPMEFTATIRSRDFLVASIPLAKARVLQDFSSRSR